jgi:hypothetical protein
MSRTEKSKVTLPPLNDSTHIRHRMKYATEEERKEARRESNRRWRAKKKAEHEDVLEKCQKLEILIASNGRAERGSGDIDGATPSKEQSEFGAQPQEFRRETA